MPRNDQTGPLGQGSMTGRGLGQCSTTNNNVIYGYGRGRRQEYRANCNYIIPNQTSLEEEKKILENRLTEINNLLKK